MGGVSAIVVTYKTGFRLKDCLWTLVSDPDVQEIIVIDNGNPPDMTDWLSHMADQHRALIHIEMGENLGFGKAANIGAGHARGEGLLFINPDCQLKRGALAAFSAAHNGRQTPCLVGGRIFDLSGQEVRGGRRHELTLARALLRLAGIDRLNLHLAPSPESAVPMGAVSGALFFMSKVDFQHIGGFDEQFFLHFEDLDLCARMHKAGGEVVYAPDAAGLHYGATSDVPRAFINRHKTNSLIYYLKKHAVSPYARIFITVLAPLIRGLYRLRT